MHVAAGRKQLMAFGKPPLSRSISMSPKSSIQLLFVEQLYLNYSRPSFLDGMEN